MKKLHVFILKSFTRPFFTSFFVVLFILVLQFMSKYKDDLFGKGLEAIVLLKVFYFASAHLVILALPLAVLLSSLMTMGTMGQQYELAAMKSSGISLVRVMIPILAVVMVISGFSFWFSFSVIPKANLKLFSLLYDVQKAKPAFSLKEGHFYSGIDGYVIRVNKKDVESEKLYSIMIYDHTYLQGNDKVVLADSGTMTLFEDEEMVLMRLYHGTSHENFVNDASDEEKSYRYGRYYFDTLVYRFDISGLGIKPTDESRFSSHQYMQDLPRLQRSIDSVTFLYNLKVNGMPSYMSPFVKLDTTLVAEEPPAFKPLPWNGILGYFDTRQAFPIVMGAIDNSLEVQRMTEQVLSDMKEHAKSIRQYEIEFHGKFSLPIACLIFLFIGAPLGAIIRKGGIGMPVLISIVFFIFYYLLMLQGKRLATDAILPVWVGVWLPILILTPAGIFLTYESTTDSRLLGSEFWYNIARPFIFVFEKIKSLRSKPADRRKGDGHLTDPLAGQFRRTGTRDFQIDPLERMRRRNVDPGIEIEPGEWAPDERRR